MNTPKKVSADSQLTLHMIIRLENGEIAENTRRTARPTQARLGNGSLSENFEKALMGLAEGEKKTFHLSTEDTFGPPQPENVMTFPRGQFPTEILVEPGMMIEFENMNGSQMIGIVRAIHEDQVSVDFNHPLAGHALEFEVEVLEIL